MTVIAQYDNIKNIPTNVVNEQKVGNWYSWSRILIFKSEDGKVATVRAVWWERMLAAFLNLVGYDYFAKIFEGKKVQQLTVDEVSAAVSKKDPIKPDPAKELKPNKYFDQVLQRAGGQASEPSSDEFVVELKYDCKSVTLEFLNGGISGYAMSQVEAVVNAANDTLFYGGAGTNAALSKVFDKDAWVASAKKHNSKMEVSEVVVFDFKAAEDVTTNVPKYLFQALGPVLGKEKLEVYREQVYKAYKNIFAECRKLKVESILLCLLSSGIFAGTNKDNPVWKQHVQEALFQAMDEELKEPNGSLHTIKIIDYNVRPFSDAIEAFSKKNSLHIY